jgi:hypothetical protein
MQSQTAHQSKGSNPLGCERAAPRPRLLCCRRCRVPGAAVGLQPAVLWPPAFRHELLERRLPPRRRRRLVHDVPQVGVAEVGWDGCCSWGGRGVLRLRLGQLAAWGVLLMWRLLLAARGNSLR